MLPSKPDLCHICTADEPTYKCSVCTFEMCADCLVKIKQQCPQCRKVLKIMKNGKALKVVAAFGVEDPVCGIGFPHQKFLENAQRPLQPELTMSGHELVEFWPNMAQVLLTDEQYRVSVQLSDADDKWIRYDVGKLVDYTIQPFNADHGIDVCKREWFSVVAFYDVENQQFEFDPEENIPDCISHQISYFCRICQQHLQQTQLDTHMANERHTQALSEINTRKQFFQNRKPRRGKPIWEDPVFGLRIYMSPRSDYHFYIERPEYLVRDGHELITIWHSLSKVLQIGQTYNVTVTMGSQIVSEFWAEQQSNDLGQIEYFISGSISDIITYHDRANRIKANKSDQVSINAFYDISDNTFECDVPDDPEEYLSHCVDYRCDACECQLEDISEVNLHIRSQEHLENLKT